MKRFLTPLLAALALPTAIHAESYWLVLSKYENAIEKIEMKSMEQCEEQGEKWVGNMWYKEGYKCLIGK
mgnify:CR=1 FL=1